MNKTYYTVYLPTEGIIKDGDMYQIKSVGTPKLRTMGLYPKWGRYYQYNQKDVFCRISKLVPSTHKRKVNLFLCSKDIKAGDKLRCYKPDKSEWVECTFIEELHGVVNGKDYDTYQCEFANGKIGGALKENFFKVIGQVSPDANWATEGMELSYEDIRIGAGKISDDTGIKNRFLFSDFSKDIPNDGTIDWFPNNGWDWFVQLKGPCKHFH